MSTIIDARAVVSSKAELGNDVTIGPFTVVEAGAVIGDGTSVAANALVATGARIGKSCKLHHGVVVGHVPQDLKYGGEPTVCEVGDRTELREFCTLHRGTGEGGRTLVGSDCFLMAGAHVAHDCVVGDHVIMANCVLLGGHVEVGDWAIIGGGTPVHQWCHLGPHVMIGGGTIALKDVPPYALAGNKPLRFEGLNTIGLRRRGFAAATIAAIDRAYTHIYRSGLNVSQGIARIREDAELCNVAEVKVIMEFIGKCRRGIIGLPRSHD
jgi:UDP-N-acetylglucosamine acyltransferase